MGNKKRKNTDYMYEENESRQNNKFSPKDLLCVAAAVLFLGLWVANQFVENIPGYLVIGVYVAVVILMAAYLFTGEKFLNLWKQWDIHKKIYFFILILADIIALLTYDIAGNIFAIIVFLGANYFYYLIFLRIKQKNNK